MNNPDSLGIKNQISKFEEIMKQMINSTTFTVEEISKNKGKHDVKGVYLIRRPDNREIVYVGKTRTGKISGRMNQHLNMIESSDLKMMVKERSDFPPDHRTYLVQYLELENDRERGLLEDFLISVINPVLNKVEN